MVTFITAIIFEKCRHRVTLMRKKTQAPTYISVSVPIIIFQTHNIKLGPRVNEVSKLNNENRPNSISYSSS